MRSTSISSSSSLVDSFAPSTSRASHPLPHAATSHHPSRHHPSRHSVPAERIRAQATKVEYEFEKRASPAERIRAQAAKVEYELAKRETYAKEPEIIDCAICDILAVKDRDPACEKYMQALFFKGFQAVQCYRVAHYLWKTGRTVLALAIQSRMSQVFHTDIHPAATLGRGILLDHATGVVIGETTEVGDNVSMLHRVCLGGSGTDHRRRHPKIGHGVLLGAGVNVLGPVTIGRGSKVGAGSLLITDLPEYSVAVGIPARVVKRDQQREPVQEMDQITGYTLDYVI
eukprot:gene18956-25530_t